MTTLTNLSKEFKKFEDIKMKTISNNVENSILLSRRNTDSVGVSSMKIIEDRLTPDFYEVLFGNSEHSHVNMDKVYVPKEFSAEEYVYFLDNFVANAVTRKVNADFYKFVLSRHIQEGNVQLTDNLLIFGDMTTTIDVASSQYHIDQLRQLIKKHGEYGNTKICEIEDAIYALGTIITDIKSPRIISFTGSSFEGTVVIKSENSFQVKVKDPDLTMSVGVIGDIVKAIQLIDVAMTKNSSMEDVVKYLQIFYYAGTSNVDTLNKVKLEGLTLIFDDVLKYRIDNATPARRAWSIFYFLRDVQAYVSSRPEFKGKELKNADTITLFARDWINREDLTWV